MLNRSRALIQNFLAQSILQIVQMHISLTCFEIFVNLHLTYLPIQCIIWCHFHFPISPFLLSNLVLHKRFPLHLLRHLILLWTEDTVIGNTSTFLTHFYGPLRWFEHLEIIINLYLVTILPGLVWVTIPIYHFMWCRCLCFYSYSLDFLGVTKGGW